MDNYRRRLAVLMRLLPPADLAALRKGLASGDPALIHGGATDPTVGDPALECRGADLLAYGTWKARGLRTTAQVTEAWNDWHIAYETATGHCGEVRCLLATWDGLEEMSRERARAVALWVADEEVERRRKPEGESHDQQ